jgi:chromosome segregation ATPase
LTKEVKLKEAQVESEVTETRAAQIELDKTGVEFRNLHKERQNLLHQWEETIGALEKRDAAISVVNDDIQRAETDVNYRLVVIKDKEKFLKEEVGNNKEVENKIENGDRMLAKLRQEYGTAEVQLTDFEDGLETIKNTLFKASANLESKKAEIVQFQKELFVKQKRIERNKHLRDNTKEDLEKHYQKTDDLDERRKQVEMYFKAEEQKLNSVEKEIDKLKLQQFKESQELFKLHQEEQNLSSEINGAIASEKNLQAKIHKLDNESVKQQELIYNQEYQLQQLERKIGALQREKSNEEKKILTTKIKELNGDLEKQNEKYNLLMTQYKKIEDDVKNSKKKLEEKRNENENFGSKINEMSLENENALKQLKVMIKRKEDLIVNENFVRLDVKRLRDLLYYKSDRVFSLENRKIQLKLAMEERKAEINVHKDYLKAQLRTIEDERHEKAKTLAIELS